MPEQVLSKRVRVAILLGILVALSLFVGAVVVFIQEGDWPARYVSTGVTILAVMLIAVRKRARKC